MSANGISTLSTKELRQKAKLALAADNRAATGNRRATLDITQLPTQYDNNSIIDNPNSTGLLLGRPWIATEPAFVFAEQFGTADPISVTASVLGNTVSVTASTYDTPNYTNSTIVFNGVTIVDTDRRGHTLAIVNTVTADIVSVTAYDTYGNAASLSQLALALSGVEPGHTVILTVYDASALNPAVRSALTALGSTNLNTWDASRTSHIFIGVKA
jgi:hypothetical protein